MSSITDTLPDVPTEHTETPFLLERLSSPVSAVAFWLAIAMPMAYVPFLFSGIGGGRELLVFLGLIAVHLVALSAGRTHRVE